MNSSRSKLRDEVYTQMMCAQARLSKDQNTQMGAVLVSADGRVISTGYNGAPAGFDDDTVPYTREKQLLAYDLLDADTGDLISHHEFEANKYPFMVHAEINALHYARGKVPAGSKLYVIGFPCERCALDVSLSGVAEDSEGGRIYLDPLPPIKEQRPDVSELFNREERILKREISILLCI